jgi:mannose-6-phosphate isomerase-like protein (cupin superfamily)
MERDELRKLFDLMGPDHAEEKLWGFNKRLWLSPCRQNCAILGFEGGASSLHRHDFKDNHFLVISGRMEIQIERADGLETCYLADTESATVAAGIKHRMAFLADTLALEIYTPRNAGALVDVNDIHRFDEGWASRS